MINLGTLAIEGTLTDQRTTKTYGGTVRYSASSGSQIVVGGNYANLELSGNSTKSFDGNAQISGNFSVTGGDVTPPSSITFNGSSTQSLAGLAYNNIAFSNGGTKTFTSAASVSPTAAITFSGTAGTVDFDGDGSVEFVLRSDSNGTARVGNVNGFTLSGIVTAERYIPQGKRAFRFLTSPVNSTESIRVNWQNNGVASAGIGTHITGSGGSTNGFDTTASNSSSLFTYNNQVASGTGWTAVTNTNETTLIAGVPYRILIRGDRNVDLTAASAPNMNTAVTLRTKGTLTTGPVTYNASSSPVAINNTSNTTTNDYSLVGNPFMSPIDWHNVSKTNLENSYYAWDGNMGTNGQRGRYVTYSQTSETNNVIESAVNKFIQPGQAFFVKNSIVGTAGDLTISESNKAAIVNNPVFRNNENSSENEKLSVLLYEPTVLSLGGFPIDGTVAVFNDSFSSEVGLGDVEKLLVSGEHISFARNTVNLAIEATQPPQTDDELFLRLLQFVASRNYTFKITAANFNASTTAFLIDNFLNTATEIDLEEDFFHTFETTTNSASFNQDRFKIVFNSSVLSTPEFNLESLSVYPNPVTDCQFWVYCPIEHSQDLNLILYSVLGNKIDLKISPDNSGLKVQLPSHLNAGVYFLTLELGGKKSVKKLIVK